MDKIPESNRTLQFHSLGNLARRLISFISLMLMALILSILSPYFLTFENIFAIGLQMSVIAIMAIGQMLIIISAGIDLSVGSILALSGVVCTSLMAEGFPLVTAVAGGIGVL